MSYGERIIGKYLKAHHISNKYRLIPTWLHGLHLDFYIPSLRLGIEFDGYQHFFPTNLGNYNGDDELLNGYINECKRDTEKDKLCKNHNINLLRIENYTKENLDKKIVIKFIKHGLHVAKLLKQDNEFQNILYEPHYIHKFKVHISAINNALPITTNKLWHKIRDYISSQRYGLAKLIITELLITSFLHTQDVFKLTYDDIFNEDKSIKNEFMEENQSIGIFRNNVHFPLFLKKPISKYITYLHNHNLTSKWLFPDPNNPQLHVSFAKFSKFINKVAKHFNLKHFNIYSLRKTGGYMIYSQHNLKIATDFLNESNDIATYDYLGYDGEKLMDKITDKIFGNK